MEPHADKEDVENGNKSFRGVIADFMGYTTAHGFGRLVATKSFLWKILWILGILAGFVMFVLETMSLFKLYLSRPVQTSVSVVHDTQLTFPAVTICNLNKIRKSMVNSDDFPKDLRETLLENKNVNTTPNNTTRRRRKRAEPTSGMKSLTDMGSAWYDDDWEDSEYSSDIDDEYPDESINDEEERLEFEIDKYLSSWDATYAINNFGHRIEDFIVHCIWKGVWCNGEVINKFWRTSWNHEYGNCFTFNGGRNDTDYPTRVLRSSKPGPSNGLSLQLDVEFDEYIGVFTEEAGVRVVLHEQGSTPFPYEEGFSVAPGRATSVGLRKILTKRVDRFDNGSCHAKGVPLSEDNIYRKYENFTLYSFQACLNSCLGKNQLARCKCTEAAYPSETPCFIFDSSKCLKNVKYLFSSDKLPCTQECKLPCREEIYEQTISSSAWPFPAHMEYLGRDPPQANSSRSGKLVLHIFYSQLSYQVIEESFSYGTTSLLADIGGQVGLWIGLSVLTCGEILELIYELIAVAYMRLKNRRHNRVIDLTAG